MKVNSDRVSSTCAGLGLATTLLAPFMFGAVGLGVWQSLAWLWIVLGASAWVAQRSTAPNHDPDRLHPLPGPMLALYLLVALQLVPLPPSLLRLVSPGSYAAHFIPPPAHPVWAPLTASPTGTMQALLFIAGLHGLALAIFSGGPAARAARMRTLQLGMSAVGGLMALEGLVQARSSHPSWLYGLYPVPGIGSLEGGIFGPYYNRDHYSDLLAMAAAVAGGLIGLSARDGAFRSLSAFTRSTDLGRRAALLVALILMIVASAASGSRGGLVALGVGLLVGLAPPLLVRPGLALASLTVVAVALFATGIPDAFMRMGDVDFEASRLLVWRDALRLIGFFPIFGCGIGAFAPAYWGYQRVVRFEYWPYAHNEYLQWLLEGGALGLVLAAFMVRRAWIAAPRLIRSLEARPALAGLAAALTHALVDSSFRVPANAAWAWLFLICLSLAGRDNRVGAGSVLGRQPHRSR